MGSGQSNEQAKTLGMGRLREDRKLYRLVDIHGGGELVPWLRYAMASGDHSIIDAYIDTKVREFMYNQGKGKLVTVTELVKMRNKERNERLSAFSRKKGKGKSGPNVLDDFNQEGENVGDLKKALKLLDGGGKGGKAESKYRDITWKLEERGSMGETIIGICLLQSTDIHNRLALKVLDAYPKLVNDINVSEDYYGLTPLHQAIINQDVPMVFVLLKRGADINARCYGAFFCAEDQKTSRTDSLEHEYVDLPTKTNYTGSMYFGEYPLSFAACMNQPEIYRLLLAKRANPNAQDTNGNTVLHMCVIHENMNMFRVALENGASLRIMNKQNLSPLTLAAQMGKKKMFLEILEIEGDRVWAYGDASSTAYPLAKIDTINESTGELNENSALSLVVYGETAQHLDLLDGLLDKLVEQKWQAFGKSRILRSLGAFTVHWAAVVAAFLLRPVSYTTEAITGGWITRYGDINPQTYEPGVSPMISWHGENFTWTPKCDQCHLRNGWELDDIASGYVRMGLEVFIVLSVMVQVFLDFKDIRQIGWKKWWNILTAFPAKIAYKFSFIAVALTIPVRLTCSLGLIMLAFDNVLSTLVMLLTSVHFLFYCRAIQFIGPFVLMIYTIIATDIRRFLLIYGIFLVGFSQAFYIVFLTCERAKNTIMNRDEPNFNPYETALKNYSALDIQRAKNFTNVIESPIEAFLRTFIMTIGEFTTLYRNLATCPAPVMFYVGKAIFLIFEMGVSVLQFNLLIAMMTRTYETIFSTKKEYKRQFARVILMLEVSLSPATRMMYLLKYSRPTGTNKKARSLVVNKKNDDSGDSEAVQRQRREKSEKQSEERRMLIKRKMKDLEQREGLRPMTQGGRMSTPRPVTKNFRM